MPFGKESRLSSAAAVVRPLVRGSVQAGAASSQSLPPYLLCDEGGNVSFPRGAASLTAPPPPFVDFAGIFLSPGWRVAAGWEAGELREVSGSHMMFSV